MRRGVHIFASLYLSNALALAEETGCQSLTKRTTQPPLSRFRKLPYDSHNARNEVVDPLEDLQSASGITA